MKSVPAEEIAVETVLHLAGGWVSDVERGEIVYPHLNGHQAVASSGEYVIITFDTANGEEAYLVVPVETNIEVQE